MLSSALGGALGGVLSGIEARASRLERSLITAAALLIAIGFVLALAASPVAAARTPSIDGVFELAVRHAWAVLVAGSALCGLSLLSARSVRRFCVALFLIGLPLLAAVLLFGGEIKGAQRWIRVAGVSVQPSELLKPALVVLGAWMLAEKSASPRFPGYAAIALITIPVLALLLRQPDLGQTALICLALASMVFLAGAPLWWSGVGLAIGSAAAAAVYKFYPHARDRFTAFFDPDKASGQVGKALETISSGGVFGRGPGEGIMKMSLPDAHADFVYAVAAEEFGLLLSLGLPLLYGWIAWRGLSLSQTAATPFARLASGGLITLFVLQASIHVAVNLGSIPAKGMTLPLVSFGGSSMLGSAITLGLALALLRREPSEEAANA